MIDPDDGFLGSLAERYSLPTGATVALRTLAKRSVNLEISGTAVRTAEDALRLHVADSIAGLEIDAIAGARTIADIGTGAGFPGLALAIALPGAAVTLVDAVRKKVEAAAAIARTIGLENVECVWARAEEYGAVGAPARETFDVVTARALAAMPVLIEYAAPLVRVGGALVAWKGELEPAELADAAAAERELGFDTGGTVEYTPFSGSLRRQFYVTVKREAVADRYPRRPGVAARRPIGAG